MWTYEKKLQYPVRIKTPNPALAKVIISQVGGPDGEAGASMRYLSQRFAMPYREGIATLTDIGTEELGHLEMVSAIVHQLTRCLTPEEIMRQGFADYYVDHTTGIWPQAASGTPFSAVAFQSKGDPITDLHEDMAAEQKARTTYDNILRLLDDPDIIDPIRFLRQRELVHYQRFGEVLRTTQERLNARNFYAFNPAFDPADRRCVCADGHSCHEAECACREGACCSCPERRCDSDCRSDCDCYDGNTGRRSGDSRCDSDCRSDCDCYNGNTGRRSGDSRCDSDGRACADSGRRWDFDDPSDSVRQAVRKSEYGEPSCGCADCAETPRRVIRASAEASGRRACRPAQSEERVVYRADCGCASDPCTEGTAR